MTTQKRKQFGEKEERQFFNLLPNLLSISTLEGKFLHLNPAWETVLGYTIDYLEQIYFIELVHPEDVDETLRKIHSLKNGVAVSSFTNRYRKSNGKYVFLEWNAEISNGLVYSSARDITKVKLLEEDQLKTVKELDELSSFYKTLFNAIPDVLGVQDNQHKVLFYNNAGYQFLKKTPHEVYGKKCFHLIDRPTPCEDCATSLVYKSKKPEHIVRYFPEMEKWLDLRSYPVLNEKGEIWRVIEHIRDITDITNAQTELVKIQEYFKAVLNAINDAVFIDEADTGKVIYVNNTACEMYGYSFDEMISINIEAISAGSPDYTQEKAIEQLLRSRDEGPQLFEWYAKKASGELFWVEVNARFASIGEKSYFIVSVRDITNWKENVLLLKQSEEKYRHLVDQATEMLFLHDLEGNLIDVNLAAMHETGYQRDELLSMKVFDIDPDAHDRGDLIKYWKTLKPGDHFTIGVRHLRKDGTIYPAEVTMGLVLFGKETFVMALARDITERKKAEQEILQSRDKFQNIINLAVDGILIGDTEGRITDANDHFCSMIGREKSDLLGKHIREIPFSRESIENKPFRFDLLQQGEIIVSEREIVNASGEIITVEMRSKMMPDKSYQSIFRDITKRKQAEKMLSLKNEELARLNAEKDQLMSIIGHDLRSPFMSFLGFTSMLTDPDLTMQETKFREMATNMRKSALATFRLLENLLEWSRLQRGMMTPEKKKVKMAEIIDDAIESLEETANSKMVSINRPENDQLMVYADPLMLTTVIRNILSNAIKFSYRNASVSLQLVISGDNRLQILIIDQGVGMNDATKAVLFKVDPSKSMAGTEGERSTGLGLLICKELIEMQGGNIRVISKSGRGSTFIVELPLNQ